MRDRLTEQRRLQAENERLQAENAHCVGRIQNLERRGRELKHNCEQLAASQGQARERELAAQLAELQQVQKQQAVKLTHFRQQTAHLMSRASRCRLEQQRPTRPPDEPCSRDLRVIGLTR